MKVKALKPWSNGEISMEQYEVRDLPDALAQNLIDAGIVVEIGGGSGGSVLVVHDVDGTLDKTWQEIYDALPIAVLDDPSHSTRKTFHTAGTVLHGLFVYGGDYYAANSASGYPEKTTAPK